MKNSNKLFAILFGMILMACGSSKGSSNTNSNRTNSTTAAKTTTTNPNKTNSNQDVPVNQTTSTNDGIMDSSISKDKIENDMDNQMDNGAIRDNDYAQKRTNDMYKSLNMTQEQIKRYESERRYSMDKWTQDNPQKPMDNRQWMEQEDKNLKSVLGQNQYDMYKDWTKNNPYKN